MQTAPSLRATIKQKVLLRQRVVVVIIGLNYCALGRFPIVRTDRPHQSPTSYFENEIGFFQEIFRLKNVLFRVYYLGFDWSGWRVLIKRETIIATGMVWPVSSDKWKVPFKQFPLMTSTARHSKHTDFILQWGFYYFNLFPQDLKIKTFEETSKYRFLKYCERNGIICKERMTASTTSLSD